MEFRAQGCDGDVQAFDDSKRPDELWRAYAFGDELPTQVDAVTQGTQIVQTEYKATPDLDYLQELLAIQQNGPRAIGFFGTRNMGFMHQQLIEILSYAMVIAVKNVLEMPHNDHLPLIEASRLCNMDILSYVQQVICFAFS